MLPSMKMIVNRVTPKVKITWGEGKTFSHLHVSEIHKERI